MPLEGEYEPSTSGWARRQAEAFEASDGEQVEHPPRARSSC